MADHAAISFEGVTKTYDADGSTTLDRVTFSVPEQQFLAIVGPSGSGKSTLLRLVNRLGEPSAGQIRVYGEDVLGLDPIELRRRIGYVFQGVGLFPHMTVAENIGITPRLLGWPRDRITTRVDELIRLVQLDLAHHRDRFPHELSGGERQRVGVARAIAAKPHLVLMDEPFGALDPITRDTLGGDYRRLHNELGLTTLMITHDMQEALLLADRIVVMRGGQVVADGTPQELMKKNGGDYVQALIETPRRHAAQVRALGNRESQ
jgi:osmoprotectant transport system ATP-binding protein